MLEMHSNSQISPKIVSQNKPTNENVKFGTELRYLRPPS